MRSPSRICCITHILQVLIAAVSQPPRPVRRPHAKMHTLLLLSLPFIFIITTHIVRLVKEVVTNPSSLSIPGPLLARFTRLWYLYRVWKGDFEKHNLELHEKYGPIVRISPGHYSINEKIDVKTVYGAGSRFTKSKWYDAFKPPSPDEWSVFTDRDNKRHGR